LSASSCFPLCEERLAEEVPRELAVRVAAVLVRNLSERGLGRREITEVVLAHCERELSLRLSRSIPTKVTRNQDGPNGHNQHHEAYHDVSEVLLNELGSLDCEVTS